MGPKIFGPLFKGAKNKKWGDWCSLIFQFYHIELIFPDTDLELKV